MTLGVRFTNHWEVRLSQTPGASSSFKYRYGAVSPIGVSGEEVITKCTGHLSQTLRALSSFKHRYGPISPIMGPGSSTKCGGDICRKHRGPYTHLNIDKDPFPQLRVHHDVYGATCPKHCGPHIHLNIDIDLFPQLGVRGGGHHEVYGDICSKHWVPFPHLNIDMDTLPQLGVRGGGHHENVRGHVSQTPAQFNILR